MAGPAEFTDSRGRSPFRRWFNALDAVAAARVATALYRLEQGSFSGAKLLGGGIAECRIDAGPGYRVYFARLDERTLVLLGGGTKRRQQRDIDVCRRRWFELQSRNGR